MRSSRVVLLSGLAGLALAALACGATSGASTDESEVGTRPPRQWDPPKTKAGNLRVATFNIRNFPKDTMSDSDAGADGGAAPDRDTRPAPLVRKLSETDEAMLVDILAKLDFDVLAVQEINDTRRFDDVLTRLGERTGRRYQSVYNLAWDHPQHLGIVARADRVRIESPRVHADIATRPTMRAGLSARIVSTKAGGADFGLLVLHLASGDTGGRARLRAEQASFAAKAVAARQVESGDADFVVVGDMNTARPDELSGFDGAMAESDSGLDRASRDLACSTYYTKGPTNPMLEPSLIDHVFVASLAERDESVPMAVGTHCHERSCASFESDSAEHGTSYWSVSDHCPVYFELADVDRD
ncbi:MAG: hypothetical protein KF819_28455 [Labilithrix sp.]|nr:hypothetical protein [Labilithrix sp.]